MNTPPHNTADIKPEIVFIPDLLKEMNAGLLRIPNFQRPFVWTPQKMLFLLDSIRNRYPIGSILLWDTDAELCSTPNIGPKSIVQATSGTVSYILDGQQRLSTLFGVLWLRDGDEAEWLWEVWFNLKTKIFEHLKNKTPGTEHFPMRALLDTYDFLEAAETIRGKGGEQAKEMIKEAQELAETFRSYKVPVTRIQNTTLDEAVRIFGRLNSSGVKVSDDQMVSALAYREQDGNVLFNLANEIDTLSDYLASLNFGQVNRVTLLRVILAELELDVYRTNWESMIRDYADQLPDAVKRCQVTLELVLDFLKGEGVNCGALLPYSMQIVVLSGFFRKCALPTPAQKALLRRWFWVSTYTGWFANGNSTTIRAALADMALLAEDKTQKIASINFDEPANPFPVSFDFRAARVRAQILFQLSLKPLDLNGEAIDAWRLIEGQGYQALAYIFKSVGALDKARYSSPANRILLPLARRVSIADALLNINEDKRDRVLRSHGINEKAYEALSDGDYKAFIDLRKAELKTQELLFMDGRQVKEPVEERDESILDTGEDEEATFTFL